MESDDVISQPQPQDSSLIEQAAQIVSAYVTCNHVAAGELPGLIRAVHTSLLGLSQPTAATTEPEVERPTASQIRKSITHDALISFIDGKPYKILKRHITKHGLDPYSYRARYGLPTDYPMVAASYAAQRSELARATGLGRAGAPVEAGQSRGRGRSRK
ncbi:MucR family transcriptional regulator [Methylobacterium nigriterrae]|uniref:MucR family transcriptional regulator n=1 Tax=Methylobacterium nigriterrae TaxID=3127512 RepID=UPI003013AA70